MHVAVTILNPKIIDLAAGPEIHSGQVQFDLANLANSLVRRHGEELAFFLFSESFAAVWAKWALETGKPMPSRFALEVELDNAQMRAPIPSFDIAAAPVGAA